jgi:hypothetical protein
MWSTRTAFRVRFMRRKLSRCSEGIAASKTGLKTCTWKMHRNVRETVTLMTNALADRGRRTVRGQEDVLDTVHGNPSVSTPHVFSVTGRLSQRATWRTVREIELFPFHLQPVQSCSRGQTSLSTDCVHPSISVPWRGVKQTILRRWARVCDDLINLIQVTCCKHRTWTTISLQGLKLTSMRGVCSGGGKTYRRQEKKV